MPSIPPMFPRVAVVNGVGDHLRYVHRDFARALIQSGAATAEPAIGRVRSVSLTRPASSHAQRIGEPGPPSNGVRFYRWANLDCGARVVEHHPRCFRLL